MHLDDESEVVRELQVRMELVLYAFSGTEGSSTPENPKHSPRGREQKIGLNNSFQAFLCSERVAETSAATVRRGFPVRQCQVSRFLVDPGNGHAGPRDGWK